MQQWKDQFRKWTTIAESDIILVTSAQKRATVMPPNRGIVLITTYSMMTSSSRRSDISETMVRGIRSREWGLAVLDEVHVVPAENFRKVFTICKTHCKLGLSATLVREDNKIEDLSFLIGPKLYEANWLDLTQAGYLANVLCAEVWCDMTAEFYREYLRASSARLRRLLYVMNPNKFRACEFLVKLHEERGDKVIVFFDDVFALKRYAQKLDIPMVYGQVKEQDRGRIFSSFRHSSTVNTLALSKIADVAIDLPEANVIIQISSHFGSRRQEAQRLVRRSNSARCQIDSYVTHLKRKMLNRTLLQGRILRPKCTASDADYDAYFYSLVSCDTQEMFYSAKRQQFLLDQGYSFAVKKNIVPSGWASRISGRSEELDLLREVLCANIEASAKEEDEPDEEEAAWFKEPSEGSLVFSRASGAISSLTGDDGDVVYFETTTSSSGP